MPTISVDKSDLFALLGKEYSPAEFETLCFAFGIELDEDTTEEATAAGTRPELKIEIPANRYDLLCIEGLAQLLNEYLGRSRAPEYRLVPATPTASLTITAATAAIRPYALAAILRNVTLNDRAYALFIALQDKLHANLCRNRSLVAMGTHDLAAVKGTHYVYDARKPQEIVFTPLNQTKEMSAAEMMDFYAKDKHLGRYLHIIQDLPVYPVMLDEADNVMLMPPIINSHATRILTSTRDILIDVTGTDRTKTAVVVNVLVAMFLRYLDTPFTVEPVKVISEHNGELRVEPDLAPRTMAAEVAYILSCVGVPLTADEMVPLVERMGLAAVGKDHQLEVSIPCTRPDILHPCDIVEDVAIAYGYDKLTKPSGAMTALVAQPLPVNRVGDIVRNVLAQAGYVEVMPLTLCLHDEAFKHMRQTDDSQAVVLANPKLAEYQVVRTLLLPGLLKTVRENRDHPLPIRIFEAGDVVLQAPELERRARNERRWCAVHVGKLSGFEYVQGLLGKVMQLLKAPWRENGKEGRGFWLEGADNATYFPGRAAKVMFRAKEGGDVVVVGTLGTLHPEVLAAFDIPFAAAAVEVNLEVFL